MGDYYSFNLWKNKGIFVLTPKKIDALYDAILDKEIGGRLTIFWLVKVLFRIKILEREYEKRIKS